MRDKSKSVDLKWALWSRDPSYWQEHGHKSTLDAIRCAFAGTRSPVTVYTAPRKERSFGTVTISKGKAEVNFVAVWDSPDCHVPDDMPEKLRDQATDQICHWFCDGEGFHGGDLQDPVGAKIDRTVKARSFKALLEKIDACEEDLIKTDQENYKLFEEFLATLPKK